MENHSDVFYVRGAENTYTPRKDGVSVKNGFGADIFRSKDNYYEGRTGAFIGGKGRIAGFLEKYAGKTEEFAAIVQGYEERFGLSPRYAQPDVMKADVFPRDDNKILAPGLYNKGRSRFTRVYNENGIELYTMDKDKSSPPTLYTSCRGCMIGVGSDLEQVIAFLTQPGFDLYDKILKQYEMQIQMPHRWADEGIADFLGRREEAAAHNELLEEARERQRREEDAKYEAEEQERNARLQAEYETAIEGAEQALLDGRRFGNRDVNGKNLFLQLFRENGIDVPLKTQGWIKTSLVAMQVNGDDITYWRNGRPSSVICDYIKQLVEKVSQKQLDVGDAERERIIAAVADFIVKDGTCKTYEGVWITRFTDIPASVADHVFLRNNTQAIVASLCGREEVMDVEQCDDCFNIVYGLAFCPNYENEDDYEL